MSKNCELRVTILGGGVLGSQIAMQCAYKGLSCMIYEISNDAIHTAKMKIDNIKSQYLNTLNRMKTLIGTNEPSPARGLISDISTTSLNEIELLIEKTKESDANITYTTDLKAAVQNADIVIEAICENIEIKKKVYTQIANMVKPDAMIAMNSSTFLPSMFKDCLTYPENLIAIHFSNMIWVNNTTEIMGHENTSNKTKERAVVFAECIGMIPLILNKETPGYILNSLLIPFLDAGEKLFAMGIADVETIDKTWRLATGSPYGPFQMLDIIGLGTAYEIVAMKEEAKDPNSVYAKIATLLKEKIGEGEMGISTGKGFYHYS